MPIPSDDPTLRTSLDAGLGRVLAAMRTPLGVLAAYAVVVVPDYFIGTPASPTDPLVKGLLGVGLLYAAVFALRAVVRSDLRHTTSVDPETTPTGATDESLADVFLGYGFVGACAFLSGIYLGGWYLSQNPAAIGTFGTDHLAAGGVLGLAAVGLAILESYEDYLGVSVQAWVADRVGADDGEVSDGAE